jgi:MFS transporter, Spinster family, sphingosine-1-phosphate transporter
MRSISSEPAAAPASAELVASRAARWALGVLLAVNLVNYLDRQILYSLLPLIQGDMSLSDAQAGRLASAFMIVYMLAAPPIGLLADRGRRQSWLTIGVVLWSVATAASGFVGGYAALLCARAAVGIGESCYGAISPSFVAEHFPAAKRGSVLALFSMAIPVGSALGYIAGGAMGQHFGWRAAFWLVGIPGLVLAALCYRLPSPPAAVHSLSEPAPSGWDYASLFRVRSFALVTLAGAAMTFTLGGFAVWMPSFFVRQWGLGIGQAGTYFGAITVVSGVIGSLAGGWLADRALRWTSRAYFMVSGAGLLIGMPLAMLSLKAPTFGATLALLLGAEFFLFLNMGPLNAVIVAVTSSRRRSMAFAANMLVIHALGDAVSPWIIGHWSDRFGLQASLLLASAGLGVAGLLCLTGMRFYDHDSKRST